MGRNSSFRFDLSFEHCQPQPVCGLLRLDSDYRPNLCVDHTLLKYTRYSSGLIPTFGTLCCEQR